MLNKIAIGRYYYGNSWVHNWNPVVKLICNLLFVISVFLCKDWMVAGVLGILLFLLLLQSEIPLAHSFRSIWGVRYLLIFLFLFNLLFGISLERNFLLMFQLVTIILYSTMILHTTSIRNLIYAFSCLLYPLSWIKVPVSLLAQMIGMAISFLPNILIQADRIMKSMKVRGIDYKNSSIRQKFQILKVILFPLFDASLRYADGVADTMEVRLYCLEKGKINFSKQPLYFFDIFQLVLHILILILVWKEGLV